MKALEALIGAAVGVSLLTKNGSAFAQDAPQGVEQ